MRLGPSHRMVRRGGDTQNNQAVEELMQFRVRVTVTMACLGFHIHGGRHSRSYSLLHEYSITWHHSDEMNDYSCHKNTLLV